MKKGVALPYLVGLLLAIIVLAIAVYLSYRYITGEPLPCRECEARFAGWCTKCYLMNAGKSTWSGNHNMSQELWECASRCNLPQQDDCIDVKEKCKAVGVP